MSFNKKVKAAFLEGPARRARRQEELDRIREEGAVIRRLLMAMTVRSAEQEERLRVAGLLSPEEEAVAMRWRGEDVVVERPVAEVEGRRRAWSLGGEAGSGAGSRGSTGTLWADAIGEVEAVDRRRLTDCEAVVVAMVVVMVLFVIAISLCAYFKLF